MKHKVPRLKRLWPGDRRNERGDTIVEVMIVLAVLGMAIGISYATANRSLLNARQAQENSQAAELVQAQVEQLRTLTESSCAAGSVDADHCIYSGSPYGAADAPFCLVSDEAGNAEVKNAKTQHACKNAGENGRYALTITREGTTDTFTVTATWDDVLGEGTDTVTLSYRLPPLPSIAQSCPEADETPPNCTPPPQSCPEADETPPDCTPPPSVQLGLSADEVDCAKTFFFIHNPIATLRITGPPGDTVSLTSTIVWPGLLFGTSPTTSVYHEGSVVIGPNGTVQKTIQHTGISQPKSWSAAAVSTDAGSKTVQLCP